VPGKLELAYHSHYTNGNYHHYNDGHSGSHLNETPW